MQNLKTCAALAALAISITAAPDRAFAQSCNDGSYSSSIGHQGACSWHGGVDNGYAPRSHDEYGNQRTAPRYYYNSGNNGPYGDSEDDD